MQKSHRDYNGKSFLRKLGPECLKMYLQESEHPLKQMMDSFLEDGEDYNQQTQAVFELFESDDNPQRQQDSHNWALINDLASEKGYAEMRRACKDCNLEHLLQEDTTPHSLAMELFLNHRFAFDHAYALLQIDFVEGWRIFRGKDISELKPDLEEAKQNLQSGLIDFLRRHGHGREFNIDLYQSQGRMILDMRYAGQLVRHENFDEAGQLRATSIRKPMEIGLVYYPETALLKVKTPRGQDALSDAVKQEFAFHYLQNPYALLESKDGQVINLEELKTRRAFPPTDPEHKVRQVRLTSVQYLPVPGIKDKVTINSSHGRVWERLEHYREDLTRIELVSAGIQFEFEGKGKGRLRTVHMTDKKNRVTLNNSQRDDVIALYLQRWGLLNV